MSHPRPLLALDTSTPHAGVAVAAGGRLLAQRGGTQRDSSVRLLSWIEEALADAGLGGLADLAGIVALRGPGSFTGLRVGLATALGFHQASGLPATGLPTLQVLAAAAADDHGASENHGADRAPVLALVPALPGEWFAQPWSPAWSPRPHAEPRRLPAAQLRAFAAECGCTTLVAATAEELASASAASGLEGRSSGPLAPVAARLASLHPPDWDATLLTAPLYLAPPPVTLPGAAKRVMPEPLPGRAAR